jgi:hypothetical protein
MLFFWLLGPDFSARFEALGGKGADIGWNEGEEEEVERPRPGSPLMSLMEKSGEAFPIRGLGAKAEAVAQKARRLAA